MSSDAEQDAIYGLRDLAKDEVPEVRIAAARGLARYIHHMDAIYGLRDLAKDTDPRVRQAAALALGGSG